MVGQDQDCSLVDLSGDTTKALLVQKGAESDFQEETWWNRGHGEKPKDGTEEGAVSLVDHHHPGSPDVALDPTYT